MTSTKPLPLPDATDIINAIKQGKTSGLAIIQQHIERCKKLNPSLNAITETFYQQALAESENPKPGPLSGLPISLKETIALQGNEITAGSIRMPAIQCQEDAEIVKRLKQAGAIILARSTVPEFVMAAETSSLRWGTTNHPIDNTRTCGGSTGGEAALISTGCTAVGIGTDILGSIRGPSNFCGIVGFRPASNRVDKKGIWTSGVGYFETFNGVGPMARSVRDIELIYSIISDFTPTPSAEPQTTQLIIPSGLNIPIQDPAISHALEMAHQHLIQLGMHKEAIDFSDCQSLLKNLQPLVAAESAPKWRCWLNNKKHGEFEYHREVLSHITGTPTISPALLTWFGVELMNKPNQKSLDNIIEDYEIKREKYHDLLSNNRVLILPTTGLLAPKHNGMNMLKFTPKLKDLVTPLSLINALNLSAITIPAHNCKDSKTGLIPGITLATASGSENTLLQTAKNLEIAFSNNKISKISS